MSLDAIKRQTVDRRARIINIVGPATSINQINLTKLNNMDTPKFCVDCRWCVSRSFEHGTAYACTHQDAIASKGAASSIDLVTGEKIDIFERTRMCGTMRGFDMCGPNAKLWEEKDAINNEHERLVG